MRGLRVLIQDSSGFQGSGSGFRVSGSGFRGSGSGFRGSGSGFRSSGPGFGVGERDLGVLEHGDLLRGAEHEPVLDDRPAHGPRHRLRREGVRPGVRQRRGHAGLARFLAEDL